MPGPVNSASAASAIAALVRQAMSGQAPAKRQRNGPLDKAAKPLKQHANATLAELIAARADELDPNAGDYPTRLLRLVVEASLLHEFGRGLLNAPKFQYMVDQVLHELESAPQLQADVQTVLNGLSGLTKASP